MSNTKDQKISKGLIYCAVFSTVCMIAFSLCVFSSLFLNIESGDSISVPQLVGERVDSAEELSYFELKKTFVFSDSVPEGIIISQHPSAGELRKKRSDGNYGILRITVSLGKERMTVPSLEGENVYESCALLRSMGLDVRIVPIYSQELLRDTVISSSPSGGEYAEEGDRVTLFVGRPVK